jgi:hypothetical protein
MEARVHNIPPAVARLDAEFESGAGGDGGGGDAPTSDIYNTDFGFEVLGYCKLKSSMSR